MNLNTDNWKIRKDSTHFPFAQIENFLTDEDYNKLKDIFPQLSEFSKYGDVGENNIILKKAYRHLVDENDTNWKQIGDYFTSDQFFNKMCDFYKEDIKKHYPELYERIQKNEVTIGKFGVDSWDDYEILLDFHLGINTPVKEVSTCRGPHLDNRKVLYVGLCYFKGDEDTTNSGHYTAYKLIKDRLKLGTSRSVSLDDVEVIDQVVYKKNTLATFLNTPLSIHGVSDREITDIERKFFVFNAVCRDDLYTIKKTFFEKVVNKILGR